MREQSKLGFALCVTDCSAGECICILSECICILSECIWILSECIWIRRRKSA